MVDGVSDTMMSVMLNSHSCCHSKSQNNGNLEETKINKEPLFTFKFPFGIWLCNYYLFTLITTTAQNPPPTLATYLHDAASLDTADPMEHRARSPSPKYLERAAAHTAPNPQLVSTGQSSRAGTSSFAFSRSSSDEIACLFKSTCTYQPKAAQFWEVGISTFRWS